MSVSLTEYGQGYAWEPSSLSLYVGDKVSWRWTTPSVSRQKYAVFSVSKPSGLQDEGGPFSSGAATANGKMMNLQNEFCTWVNKGIHATNAAFHVTKPHLAPRHTVGVNTR